MPRIETEVADPWDSLESIAEIVAFVHARCGGADAVRQCLDQEMTRECLEKAAAELEFVGLGKVSAIVRDEASERPSSIEWNPYPEGSIDSRAWIAAWHRRNA